MKTLTAPVFVRWLKDILDNSPDSKFVWFLGAGCSVSSGIKSANDLTIDWIDKLRANEQADKEPRDEWTKRRFDGFDGSYGALYGEVMRERFPTEKLRQDEVERLTTNRQPGFGYAVLAQLLSQPDYGTKANVVLTTNFDDLVADSLYLYSGQRPRVFAHESLINYVRTTSSRPLVIKLHGDSHIGAKNTEAELCTLADSVERLLAQLLHERGLIFLGYGGHDQSITKALRKLPKEAVPYGVYWVRSTLPDTDLGQWMIERGATHVPHTDFDEFMLYLRQAFDLEHPSEKPFEALMRNYRDRFDALNAKASSAHAAPELKAAMESAVSKATDWWAVELEARKYEKTDPEKAEKVYRDGVDKFPDSAPLFGNYALFLKKNNRAEEAETLFKRALAIDPRQANIIGNYAVFLESLGRNDEAEHHYKKSLEIDSSQANHTCNYAEFLLIHGREEGQAMQQRAESMWRSKELGNEPLLGVLYNSYVFGVDRAACENALVQLCELLTKGVRCDRWSFREVLKHIDDKGAENRADLHILADVINDKRPLEDLRRIGFCPEAVAGKPAPAGGKKKKARQPAA